MICWNRLKIWNSELYTVYERIDFFIFMVPEIPQGVYRDHRFWCKISNMRFLCTIPYNPLVFHNNPLQSIDFPKKIPQIHTIHVFHNNYIPTQCYSIPKVPCQQTLFYHSHFQKKSHLHIVQFLTISYNKV